MRGNALPYAIRPSKTISLIQFGDVGARPLCFATDAEWREHLMYQHASGQTVTRRQDLGKHRGDRQVKTVFARADYCEDCQRGGKFQTDMQRAGRCADQLKAEGNSMLKTLISILAEVGSVAKDPQISIVPNRLGMKAGIGIVMTWGVDDKTHEVAMHYTGEEIEQATGEQVAESLTRLAAEAREEATRSMVSNMTAAEMQSRIQRAARQSPKRQAADRLAKIAEGA